MSDKRYPEQVSPSRKKIKIGAEESDSENLISIPNTTTYNPEVEFEYKFSPESKKETRISPLKEYQTRASSEKTLMFDPGLELTHLASPAKETREISPMKIEESPLILVSPAKETQDFPAVKFLTSPIKIENTPILQTKEESFVKVTPEKSPINIEDSPTILLQTKEEYSDSFVKVTPEKNLNNPPEIDGARDLKDQIEYLKISHGLDNFIEALLNNQEIKHLLMKKIVSSAHKQLKTSLGESILCSESKHKDRRYLFSLTPYKLCTEMHDKAKDAFQILILLLGVKDFDTLIENKHYINVVTSFYSLLSKSINRNATGYALLQTSMVRDGGLREDSIKLFPYFVHPRTVQHFDVNTLAVDWNKEFMEALQIEKDYFHEVLALENEIENLKSTQMSVDNAVCLNKIDELEKKRQAQPNQMDLIFDNCNLSTKPRYKRHDDDYSKFNFDWVASIWVKGRSYANHMDNHPGRPLKDPTSLVIGDFVPNPSEMNYIFTALVFYYEARLKQRFPKLFESINSHVREHRPHQLEETMKSKSKVFSGTFYPKSESSQEDMIMILDDIQSKYTPLYSVGYTDTVQCYEKKIISGDQKSEKNAHYAILRYIKFELRNYAQYGNFFYIFQYKSFLCYSNLDKSQ